MKKKNSICKWVYFYRTRLEERNPMALPPYVCTQKYILYAGNKHFVSINLILSLTNTLRARLVIKISMDIHIIIHQTIKIHRLGSHDVLPTMDNGIYLGRGVKNNYPSTVHLIPLIWLMLPN